MGLFIPQCSSGCSGETAGGCCASAIITASGGNEGLDQSFCLQGCFATDGSKRALFILEYETYTITDRFLLYSINASGTESLILDSDWVSGPGSLAAYSLCGVNVPAKVRLVVQGGGAGTAWVCTLTCSQVSC